MPAQPAHARRSRRSGFTLLEVVLAATLGTLVMAGVLSIFFSLERTSTSLQVRGDQAAGLQRTRLVMQRAFNSILTAQVQLTRTPTGAVSDEETAPPRVLLEPDANLPQLMRRPEADGTQTVSPVQRLEIVLIDPPVPARARDPFELARAIEERTRPVRERRDDEATEAANAASTTPPNVDDAVRAVRGAFELRPQATTAQGRASDEQAYELWWVPLRLEDEDADQDREDAALEDAVERAAREREYLIAGDLTFVRWRMFDDRLKKTEFRAVAANKLPAYIEMQVRTRGGLEGEWLFEVGWAMGPETSERQAATNSTGGAGAGAGTGSGAGSGAQPVGTPIAQPVPLTPAGQGPGRARPNPINPSASPRMPPRSRDENPRNVPNRVRRRTLGNDDAKGGGS